MVWDEGGNPVLTTAPLITKAQLDDVYHAAAAEPYVCDDPLSEDYILYNGLPVAEVLVRKQLRRAAASGDVGTIETVMDRLMGRPKQSQEIQKLTMTYEQMLKLMAGRAAARGRAVEAERVEGADELW